MKNDEKTTILRLKNYFSVKNISSITWSHAANSKEKVRDALHSHKHFIEIDFRAKLNGQPVAKHNPDDKSDLTIEEIFELIKTHKIGLKLDIKESEIVEELFKNTSRLWGKLDKPYPIILNADVIAGPGVKSTDTGLPLESFVRSVINNFGDGKGMVLLSLGARTAVDNNGKAMKNQYTERMFEELLQTVRLLGWQGAITIPFRAAYLLSSTDETKRFLNKNPDVTLTVWNNEPVEQSIIDFLDKNFSPDQYFKDIVKY